MSIHKIRIYDTNKAPKIFDINLEHPTIIGRVNACDITYVKEGISRYHARLRFNDGVFYITDMGSANGTYINGEKIEPDKEYLLNLFDSVHLANLYEINLNYENLFEELKSQSHQLDKTPIKTKVIIPPKDSKQLNNKTTLNTPNSTSFKKGNLTRQKRQKSSNLRGTFLLTIILGMVIYSQKDKILERLGKKEPKPILQAEAKIEEEQDLIDSDQAPPTTLRPYQVAREENPFTKPKCNDEISQEFCKSFAPVEKNFGFLINDTKVIGFLDYKSINSKVNWAFNNSNNVSWWVSSKFNFEIIEFLKDKKIEKFQIDFAIENPFGLQIPVKVDIDLASFYNANKEWLLKFSENSTANSNEGPIQYTTYEDFLKKQEELKKKEIPSEMDVQEQPKTEQPQNDDLTELHRRIINFLNVEY